MPINKLNRLELKRIDRYARDNPTEASITLPGNSGGGGFLPSTATITNWWTPRKAYSNHASFLTLPDQIGGVDLSSATVAASPTVNLTGLNNKPTIVFDGTNDGIQTSTFSTLQPFFVCIVFRVLTGITAYACIIDGGSTGSTEALLDINSGELRQFSFNAGSPKILTSSSVVTDNQWYILMALFHLAGFVRLNGTSVLSGDTSTTINPGGLSIGMRGGTGSSSKIEVAEVMLGLSVPTNTNLNYLGSNLASIYGLTWNSIS